MRTSRTLALACEAAVRIPETAVQCTRQDWSVRARCSAVSGKALQSGTAELFALTVLRDFRAAIIVVVRCGSESNRAA
jgi:hypothetical protein